MEKIQSITGRTILLLEDDPVIRTALADLLDELGCILLGPFSSNGQALRALSDPGATPHVGIFDIALGRETCLATACEFDRRFWPYILMSGISDAQVPWELRHCPYLEKPFSISKMEQVLHDVLTKHPADQVRLTPPTT